MDINKIEERGEYSENFMREIGDEFEALRKYSSTLSGNNLANINKKIDRARNNNLLDDKALQELDKTILEFRVILLKRDIANKIDEVTKDNKEFDKGDESEKKINHFLINEHTFETKKIELEYEQVKLDKGLDDNEKSNIINKMNNLYYEVERGRIKYMIDKVNKVGGTTPDSILDSMEKAENEGINIDDLKEEFMAFMMNETA